MELYVVNVDGTRLRQITDLGNANCTLFSSIREKSYSHPITHHPEVSL